MYSISTSASDFMLPAAPAEEGAVGNGTVAGMAVEAGAKNATWSVSSISSAAKTPCPIEADAVPAEPPKPELKLRSMINSTIHAKPARSTR